MCNKIRVKLPRTVLPSVVQPLRYKSHFQPCLKTFSFVGDQTITLDIKAPVKSITLHAKDLLVESPVKFTDAHGHEVLSTGLLLNSVDNTVSMQFPSELPAGVGFLMMKFHGTLNDQMAGFYRSGYIDSFGKKQHMGVTQLEAIDARRMFPCVDEPAAKAEFEISVTAASNLMILSNMPEARKVLRVSGTELLQEVQFMPSPKMSTYLVALCLGEFEFVQATTKRGTLVRVLAPPGKASQCEFALDVGVRCLEWYEDFFQEIYPLPKLDMVAVPDFAAGAMENWGLVTYREIDLLCDVKTVSAARMQRLASVVTHELAHQWFGNLVTMEWWDDLWLNEGFATFMQTLSADALFPEWKLWDQYITDDLDAARSLDGRRSSHPVQVPIPKAEDVEEVFDAISYCKGACVVRVIYHVLGAEKFRQGIRTYIKRHAMGNTVTDDLWDALQEAQGESKGWTVSELMGSWTQQMGYPVLKVKLADDKKGLLIRQEWFLADGSVREGDDKLAWMVPVFVGSSADPSKSEMHVIRDKETLVPIPVGSAWVKVNYGEVAPVRVQYESRELLDALLKNGVETKQLSVCDRVGLLSDARALTRAGRMGLSEVLPILKAYALAGEDNADVWTGIAATVFNIEKVVASLGKSPEFSKLVMALVRPQLIRIGWDSTPTDMDGEKRLRACLFRLLSSFAITDTQDADIRNEALRRFNTFKIDQNTPLIIADTRSAIFKLALAAPESADQGRADWTFLKNLALVPSTPQGLRLDIYSALGYVACNSSKRATLDWILTDDVKIQDFFYPVGGVTASGEVGAELAWSWLSANFELCRKRVAKANPTLLGSVIASAAAGSTSDERATEIEKRYGSIPSLKRKIAQIVESIRSNAQFVRREKDVVHEF